MIVVYADALFEDHEAPYDHPECPERLVVAASALEGSPAVARVVGAAPGERADAERIHDPRYVRAIEEAAARGGGSLDPDTFVGPRSHEVALGAIGTLAAATDAALAAEAEDDPARRALALVRPPGHHARPAIGMGFCLYNTIAIAAARARAEHGLERIAIVDFDVHHGNGTQEAFYGDGGVLYASVHQDRFYPGTGAADETGVGAGKGATVNAPVPAGTGGRRFRDALGRVLERVDVWKPELLLVSAGFDAYREDPLASLRLEAEDFRSIGEQLLALSRAHTGGRIVSVLEGGYALDALGDLVTAYAEGISA